MTLMHNFHYNHRPPSAILITKIRKFTTNTVIIIIIFIKLIKIFAVPINVDTTETRITKLYKNNYITTNAQHYYHKQNNHQRCYQNQLHHYDEINVHRGTTILWPLKL